MRLFKNIFGKKETRQSVGEFNALTDLMTSTQSALSYHYSCIRFYTDLITTLPIYVANDPDHYLNRVLKTPSYFFDTSLFYSKIVANFFQYGQAFAIINFNEDTGQIENFTLDFTNQVFQQSNGLYRYKGNILFPSQVIHIRDVIGHEFNAISRRRHLSDLENRANDLATLKTALLKTNFSPTLFIGEPPNITPEKEKAFKKALENYIQSSSRAKVLPVPHGIELKNVDLNKKSFALQQL